MSDNLFLFCAYYLEWCIEKRQPISQEHIVNMYNFLFNEKLRNGYDGLFEPEDWRDPLFYKHLYKEHINDYNHELNRRIDYVINMAINEQHEHLIINLKNNGKRK